MSAPQFTSGPWQRMNDYDGALTIIGNVDGESFSDGTTSHSYDFIANLEDKYGEATSAANQRLILAAPELFNGCNALLGILQLLLNRDDLSPEVRDALTTGHRIDEARAAVAKAARADEVVPA